jgi:hypothetical protein
VRVLCTTCNFKPKIKDLTPRRVVIPKKFPLYVVGEHFNVEIKCYVPREIFGVFSRR